MLKRNKEAVKEHVEMQSGILNQGAVPAGEVFVSDEDITDQGWSAYEILFHESFSLDDFPPIVSYQDCKWTGSFMEGDYDVDGDGGSFNIYEDKVPFGLSAYVFDVLNTHLENLFQEREEESPKPSDVVNIGSVKDEDLKSDLQELEIKYSSKPV